jgi:ankyrin repeat protein
VTRLVLLVASSHLRVFGSSRLLHHSKRTTFLQQLNPQSYLNALMRSRGYNPAVVHYDSLQTAYYNKPTDLQQASYDVHLIDLVKNHQLDELRDCLAMGLSPNPCNAWGESVLHLLCRTGSPPDVLQVFVEAGADLQVVDDYGRTLLHDACWSVHPCMATIEMLLDADVHLLQLRDCRGAQPLSYVPEAHWADWMTFLGQHKDKYFPMLPAGRNAPADPPNALSIELARMVASGRMSPAEVRLLLEEDDDEEDDDSDDESYDFDKEEDSWESRYGATTEDNDYIEVDDDDDNSSLSTNEHDSQLERSRRIARGHEPVVESPPDKNHSTRSKHRSIMFGGRSYSFSGSEGSIPAMDSLKDTTIGMGDEDDKDADDFQDHDDDDDLSSDDDDYDEDASLLEEVVGILGIARPHYQTTTSPRAASPLPIPDLGRDAPHVLPPVSSISVNERVTQEFFASPSRRNSECSTTTPKQDLPIPTPLLLHDNGDENDDLLAFAC